MTHDELAAHARAIIDANLYLTLGTAGPDGHPWTSPVYFASAGDREFYWTSATDARHSRHLAERPQVSMVIFDSTVAPYHGRAVYAVGEARELSGSDLDRALSAYPRPDGRGATPVTREEVTGRPRTASTRRRCRTCGSCVPGDPDSRACSTASPWTTEPA
jgi:nitroimidazol reductase NimA-like FMN-containing flavoprotein (pyridoxamine 5'-phosphate oxidase superfamily)